MEALERIFEIVTSIFSGIGRMVERTVTSIFGSANARYVKRLQPKVDAINALEPKYEAMSAEELRAQTDEFKQRLAAGETLDDLLVEAFAVCREAGKRYLGMRHYDVQLIGGMVLHEGNIAEMVTGEGKTLVATLPSYLNGLTGTGVHVVTVNDYLARRDMEWMGPLHMELGLTVGAIQSDMDPDERQKAYACDITYGTNNEFGFDYLRDNMRSAARDDDRYPKRQQQAQGRLNYAIVDEVDNILIDEARTPLIISGPAQDDVSKYSKADQVARKLKKDVHFELKEKEHTCHMTDEGVREAERLAGVESFYTSGNMHWPHQLDNALKAHHLYKLDVNYVVQGDEIVIVDEFTGRLMPGRNWSDGLHQAVEAKEGVRIKEENQTLATITLQNFFKLYNKISGMTGTAMTEATEFWKIYKLDVIAIPTNREMQRINHPDVIYRSEKEKFIAIADEIEQLNRWTTVVLSDGDHVVGKLVKESDDAVEIQPSETKKTTRIERDKIEHIQPPGRPVLVGTVSIEKSERLSRLLDKRGVKHEVLNAKHHKREADIVSQAGRLGAVTIATNMAGRGTDIVLGGNPETKAWAILQEKYATRLDVPREEWDALVDEVEQADDMRTQGEHVKEIGGLHVIGTERHEARRIDLQLRGRCGRQGDTGGSRFFLSLEDDLMRIFAGEWVKNMLTRLGMKEGEAIESRMVSRRIEGAQKKVEERNFEIRKNLLEYDEVMDEQRKRVYGYRQK
ncbi:MAG: preprotein translocase subunit SecA, partial [Pirellulales bacterium]|nr:preprotein translocase subunit SecA [Pirellulales bacterium]